MGGLQGKMCMEHKIGSDIISALERAIMGTSVRSSPKHARYFGWLNWFHPRITMGLGRKSMARIDF
jgi:hypothetical protein